MNFTALVVASFAVFASGCAEFGGERKDYVEFDRSGPTARTEAECVALRGRWGAVGFMLEPTCNVRPTDAGKACTDSLQCRSKCVTEADVRYGARVSGVCDDSFLPHGCMQRIHAGRAGQALCID